MRCLSLLSRHGLPLLALVAACTGIAAPPHSRAGSWEARSAQGLTVRIVQDSFRTRDAYLLTRSYPDGAADSGFGDQGVTLFSLGPDNEGPATVRLDPLGRVWVAGASAGPGDTLAAVVLRFLASGVADVSYAERGRSVSAPAGRRARALDLAPQADGSTFVAGFVLDAQGVERAGWWRLAPDGRVDTRFALGGLWVDTQAGSTELRTLATGGDGSVALGLVRGDGASAQAEIWVLPSGAASPQREVVAASAGNPSLVWTAGQWRWATPGSSQAAAHLAPVAVPQAVDPAAVADRGHVTDSQPAGTHPHAATARASAPLADAVAHAVAPDAAPTAAAAATPVPTLGTARSEMAWWWGLGLLGVASALLTGWRLRQQLRKQP